MILNFTAKAYMKQPKKSFHLQSDSNLNHALVLISVNGALGDAFKMSALTTFFGFPINNTLESQSNVK